MQPCGSPDKRLTKSNMKAAFGPKSPYASKILWNEGDGNELQLEFETCSG